MMINEFVMVKVIALVCLLCFSFTNSFSLHHTLKSRFASSPSSYQTFLQTRNLKLEIVKTNSPLYSTTTTTPENNEKKIIDVPVVKKDIFPSILTGLKNLFSGKGWYGKEYITKESLAKLGLNVLLAYGFVSNFSYVTCVIISWIAHGRKYGKSPFAPGQWKYFLLIYSGLWAANNIIRPARFSFSLIISPLFEKFINFLQTKLNLKKTTATALVVFLVNVVGTTSYLVLGLFFATRLARVPLLA